MSNIPTPAHPPPPTTQQIAGVLQSALNAGQTLLQSQPHQLEALRTTFIQFYAHPTFQLILGIPTQSPAPSTTTNNQLKAELTDIKSTLHMLSKAVTGLQSKGAPAPKLPTPPPKVAPSAQVTGQKLTSAPPTFAAKAATSARPSLIVDISKSPIPKEDRPSATDLCEKINERLHNRGHKSMFLSAAKWTGKGNLVFTASPHTTSHQLQALTPDIESLVIEYLSVFTPNPTITSRPNVKWAKLLINGVPTGVKQDRGAYTPNECHNALNSHNPIYANLRITQKPSWVRSPSSLTTGTSSSLSIAFEDPDGSQLKSLLSIRQLYLFGARAKVRRWKTASPQARTPQPSNPPSQAPLGRLEHLALPPLDLDDDIMEDPPTLAPSPRKRTLSALSPPTTAKGKKKQVGGPSEG
ncbi:hypothetical protein V8E52_011988 [Russula decolorans]